MPDERQCKTCEADVKFADPLFYGLCMMCYSSSFVDGSDQVAIDRNILLAVMARTLQLIERNIRK